MYIYIYMYTCAKIWWTARKKSSKQYLCIYIYIHIFACIFASSYMWVDSWVRQKEIKKAIHLSIRGDQVSNTYYAKNVTHVCANMNAFLWYVSSFLNTSVWYIFVCQHAFAYVREPAFIWYFLLNLSQRGICAWTCLNVYESVNARVRSYGAEWRLKITINTYIHVQYMYIYMYKCTCT